MKPGIQRKGRSQKKSGVPKYGGMKSLLAQPFPKSIPPKKEQQTPKKDGLVRRFLLKAASNLPLCFVVLCCAVFALQFGVLEPDFAFQKAPATLFTGTNCSAASLGWAFADSDRLLLYLPNYPQSRVLALFEGSGRADAIRLRFNEPMLEIARITVNGQEVCAPCKNGEHRLPAPVSGEIGFSVELGETALAPASPRLFKTALFDEAVNTHIFAPLEVSVAGTWSANPNDAMPSSFYSTDAPFHVNRVGVLSQYLSQLRWPWADYTFLSALPAALLKMTIGISHQYAYKLWSIALFFVPICIFYLFSRKLKEGRGAVFLFSSLLYLALPTAGYLTGGAADLFIYGMTAHTLATYLSLFFFFFAYEFIWEKKGLALPVIFFILAVLSNQRIVFAFAPVFAVFLASAVVSLHARRVLLLGAACAASVAWFVLPQITHSIYSNYSVLGGISTAPLPESVLGFFQLGYLFLPLFFIAGVWTAKSWRFPSLLAFCAVAVFLMALDPGLNDFYPNLDGLRLMPSFALPVFFIAGIGAREIFFACIAFSEKLRLKLKQDAMTFAGCVALSLLLPLSFLFLSGAMMVWDQHRAEAVPLALAAEYSTLQRADAISNGGRIAFVWRSEVSQYPVVDSMVDRMPLSYFTNASALATEMRLRGERLVVFGNELAISNLSEIARKPKLAQYLEMKSSPLFEELPLFGNMPMFLLKGASERDMVWGKNVAVERNSIEVDRAQVTGECLAQSCSLIVYASTLPQYSKCTASYGECRAEWDGKGLFFQVDGVPQKKFSMEIAPKMDAERYCWLVFSLVALGCCFFVSRKV